MWGYCVYPYMGLDSSTMTTSMSLYEFVMAHLRAKRIPQRRVARESGVPFSTVCKIAQGSVTDPSVHTVQKLYDYFVRQEAWDEEDAGRSHPSPLAACGRGAKPEWSTSAPGSTGAAESVARSCADQGPADAKETVCERCGGAECAPSAA